MAKRDVVLPGAVREWFQDQGRVGGYTAAKNMTAAQRAARAAKASRERWIIFEEKKASAGGQ